MANYYTLLTPAGLAKVTNAQLTSEKVQITQVAVGDANGIGYKPSGTESALKREAWRGGVTSVEVDAQNPNWIVVEAVLPSSVGGFTMREVALFDTAGDMIAIGNYPDTYKPVANDGSTMDLALRTIIEVNNASNVTLKVDPNVIVASRAYVDSKVAGAIGSTDQKVDELANAVQVLETDKADNTDLTQLQQVVTTHLDDLASQTESGHMSASDKTKLDGIAENANNYVHPTTAGNKHIPSGGTTGQILGYGGSPGVASWVNPNGPYEKLFDFLLESDLSAGNYITFEGLEGYTQIKLIINGLITSGSSNRPLKMSVGGSTSSYSSSTLINGTSSVLDDQNFFTINSCIGAATVGYGGSGMININNIEGRHKTIFANFIADPTNAILFNGLFSPVLPTKISKVTIYADYIINAGAKIVVYGIK